MKLLNVLRIQELNEMIKGYLQSKSTSIEIDIKDAKGYILSEDIYAKENTPQFHRSNVDGYALYSKDTNSASESIPSILDLIEGIGIGLENTVDLKRGQACPIATGAMLPINSDCVVMVEETEKIDALKQVLVYKSLGVNENVSVIGSDVKEDSLLFNKNTYLDERVIGVLASQGISKVSVYQKLSAIVISTGNELVEYTQDIGAAKVRNSNTLLLKGLLENNGIEVKETYLIEDDYDLYKQILSYSDVDIIVTSGGSSQGQEDYTYQLFDEITGNVLCHGLAIKPGKPTIMAIGKKMDGSQQLYLGMPGNPVSAYLVMLNSFVSARNELYEQKSIQVECILDMNVASSPGKDTVILLDVEDNIAKPILYRSANILALAKANGYLVIDGDKEGINKNEKVKVVLL